MVQRIIIKNLWRGGRVVECDCLESNCPGNGTVGSNPTLSAIYTMTPYMSFNSTSVHFMKWSFTIIALFILANLLLLPENYAYNETTPIVSANFIDDSLDNNSAINLNNIVVFVDDELSDEKSMIVHMVQAWESLSTIASKYGTTVEMVKTVNNISNERFLRIGQTLYISETPWFLYQTDRATNLMVFANQYEIDLDQLQQVNSIWDPLKPLDKWTELFVPVSRDEGIKIWLLEEPTPEPVKPVVTTPVQRRTIITRQAPTNNTTVTTQTNTKPSSQATSRSTRTVTNKEHIVAQRTYTNNIRNWFAKGHCTRYAAIKSKRAFPFLSDTKQFKSYNGNAINWYDNARNAWFRTASTPTPWAIMVVNQWQGWRSSYGHVAVVLQVDRKNNKILVEDMNYLGKYIVTQRRIHMDSTMTKATANSKPIIWFIPVQWLPERLQEKVDAL